MRVTPVDPAEAGPELRTLFTAQAQQYGRPLPSTRVMARRPSIILGHHALSSGVAESGLLPEPLIALVNRRVATHNDCPF